MICIACGKQLKSNEYFYCKECLKTWFNGDVVNNNSGGEKEIKICPKCNAYYKGTHTKEDCNYHSGKASGAI